MAVFVKGQSIACAAALGTSAVTKARIEALISGLRRGDLNLMLAVQDGLEGIDRKHKEHEPGTHASQLVTDSGRAAVDVSTLPDAPTVPALRFRLRCSSCGMRPNDVRPDWREHRASGLMR